MLEIHHILGNTYAFETAMAFLPFYRLSEKEIVLLDSGYATTDRETLTETLKAHDFRVKGILCSHSHMDHVGNVRRLCDLYGCRVAAHLLEAAVASAPGNFIRLYGIHTSDEHGGVEECFTTTDIIQPGQTHLSFCGAEFQVIPLPGHSGGHTGYITPDGVAYLGDVIMGASQLAGSKMPFTSQLAEDLASKRSLLELRANVYVAAHKAISTDIRELVEANIARLEQKLEEILSVLEGAPTGGEWLAAYCEKQGWNFRSERSYTILEFGFNSAVTYLEEQGKVVSRRVNGNRRYRKARPK